MAHPLYVAALEADTAFHTALVSAYGKARAGDMRYREHHSDADVNQTRAAFLAAMDSWRAEMERSRAEANQ